MTMTKIKTYSGIELDVRQSRSEDEHLLVAFWKHVSQVDLARRSLCLGDTANLDRPAPGADPKAIRTKTLLAFGGDSELVAIAMLVPDPDGEKAKAMVFTDERATYHGVSWALLEHVLLLARTDGIKTVESIFSAQDVRASRLEQKMGFVEVDHPAGSELKILRWTLTEPSPH